MTTSLKLRPYQEDCIREIIKNITKPTRDIVNICTGGGKSIIASKIVELVKVNVLIIQPSLEILEQNKSKIELIKPEEMIGVFSSSYGEKKINNITFATIGSIYKNPELFKDFKLVILDECHLLNNKEEESMFGLFFKDSNCKIIGLSASPFRLYPTYFWGTGRGGYGMYRGVSTKMINRTINKKKQYFWNDIIYTISIGELVKQKYLCPLKYISKTIYKESELVLNKSNTDYDLELISGLREKDEEVVEILLDLFHKQKNILVFCLSLSQCERLKMALHKILGDESHKVCSVSSKDSTKERKQIIDNFKNGNVKMVLNVGVLTTGFDMPELSCIVMLRPTQSISLYYQMLGRGVRISEGKENCLVIDFVNNFNRFGAIEDLEIKKVENKWNVITSTKKDGWHGEELYRHKIK